MEEIRSAASPDLLRLLGDSKNADAIIRDTGGSILVGEIMLFADGDKSKAVEALLQPVTPPYPAADNKVPHVIDIPHSARIYKRLLEGGHFSHQTKAVVKAESWSATDFASAWLRVVGKQNTVAIALGQGAFVVAALCDRVAKDGSEEQRRELREWFGGETRQSIEKGEMRGKAVLLQSLAALKES